MSNARIQAGWRIKLGFALFIVSIAWPIVLPLLSVLGLSGSLIATLTAVMLVAAEVMMLAGAAIAGKDGFVFIKQKVFGFLKSYGPAQEVSRIRYIIGLVMFFVPVTLGWAWPYIREYLPWSHEHMLVYAVTGDVLLLASLFVLGGGFWDKLRSLFIHRAYSVIPGQGSTDGVR